VAEIREFLRDTGSIPEGRVADIDLGMDREPDGQTGDVLHDRDGNGFHRRHVTLEPACVQRGCVQGVSRPLRPTILNKKGTVAMSIYGTTTSTFLAVNMAA
jgi:hypothetical protein